MSDAEWEQSCWDGLRRDWEREQMDRVDDQCDVSFWKDEIDSWHASCYRCDWTSNDNNFSRADVEYLAEGHRKRVERKAQLRKES